MKATLIVVTLLAGLAAGMARSTTTDESFKSDVKRSGRDPLIAPSKSTTQIRGKHVTYSGIAVQAVKTRNPLQLVNPYAPGASASAADNAVRAPSGRVRGFKLFAIEF